MNNQQFIPSYLRYLIHSEKKHQFGVAKLARPGYTPPSRHVPSFVNCTFIDFTVFIVKEQTRIYKTNEKQKHGYEEAATEAGAETSWPEEAQVAAAQRRR